MLTPERARKLAAIHNGRLSARRQRTAGFPNLKRARFARRLRSEIRVRLGVISGQWAERLRRQGRTVGDWAGLVLQFGFSEDLMRRLMYGDLRYLLYVPDHPGVESKGTPEFAPYDPPRAHPLRGLPLRGWVHRHFVATMRNF